ncbi:MAG: alpha/beta hydrolase [Chitinophagaceae bacterium]
MDARILKYRNSEVAYYSFGTGVRPVICFHGYGEEATAFAFLEQAAGSFFTFYCFDLPFHGKTVWREGLTFTPADLEAIIRATLPENKQFTLMGFSLGGRVALSLYQLMPRRIEKLILLAPDGLKVNFWYWLSTQTWAGNRLFAFTMKHTSWFFGLLKLMNKLRLVNASIFKFVNFYIGNPGVRKQLYARWTTLRRLKPDRNRIKRFIQEDNTPVRLVYGKHDRIILSSVGEKFRKGIENHCTLDVIPSGHQVLHAKHEEYILAVLLPAYP